MIYTLENNIAKLAVDTKNCEIHSFKRKDKDIEYMWNGDPKFWKGRNPTLFPHVSSPSDKILNFKGKDYKVNNHGFCRNSEFEFVEQTQGKLVFRLKDNEETYSQYPYHFELIVTYTLKDNIVSIDYDITNNDGGNMYFGFGQHPAFNCPLTSDKKFNDYYIEFDVEGDVENNRLDLSYELFDKYPTYIVNNVKSRKFTLSDSVNSVIIRTDDKYNIFAVWTPNAPFVCLEPWVNTLNTADTKVFEDIKDNICLKDRDTYHIGYSIEIV